MKPVFTVGSWRWWFKVRVTIEREDKVYAVIPSGDKELAELMCALLNEGLKRA